MTELFVILAVFLVAVVSANNGTKYGKIEGCKQGIRSYYEMDDLTESELASLNKFCENLK